MLSTREERLRLAAWVLFSGLLLLGSLLFFQQDLWWLAVVSLLAAVIVTQNHPGWVLFVSVLLSVSIGWYVLWK